MEKSHKVKYRPCEEQRSNDMKLSRAVKPISYFETPCLPMLQKSSGIYLKKEKQW